MASMVVPSNDVSELQSPLRILVRFFRRSRDKWKQKCSAVKSDIKRFQNQAADARRSRESWKTKAQLLEAEVRQLKAERDVKKKSTPW